MNLRLHYLADPITSFLAWYYTEVSDGNGRLYKSAVRTASISLAEIACRSNEGVQMSSAEQIDGANLDGNYLISLRRIVSSFKLIFHITLLCPATEDGENCIPHHG